MNEEALQKYARTVAEHSRNKQVAEARKFLKWLGKREPNKENVIKYRNHMKSRSYADGTIKQNLMIITKLFKVNGWEWPFNRGELIVVRENEVHAPTLGLSWLHEMVDVVLKNKPPVGRQQPTEKHLAFLVAATIWGLRRIELKQLDESALDIDSKTIFIQTAKGGRQRYHLIPDFAIPLLEGWGFRKSLSNDAVGKVFDDLKEMVGLTGLAGYGVNWHSIRRSADAFAWDMGFNEAQIHNFYRWKKEGRSMAIRYSGGRMIEKDQDTIKVPVNDMRLDLQFYERHPLVLMWPERIKGD